jgi:protein-L-isoaspartate(D-aspartate) O-methyltransferase
MRNLTRARVPSITPAALSLLLLAGCASQSAEDSGDVVRQDAAVATDDFREKRRQMVEEQIQARGITDTSVLAAMLRVPRHRFVLPSEVGSAYEDHPLPIEHGQTISQPYIVAYMTEAAEISPQDKVLEIGTGSGYQAAILGEVAEEVYSIEIIPQLAERAKAVLSDLGYDNVHVRAGDGYKGWAEHAPYDAILVTAAPDHVPQPLVDQLAEGGRMVIPVGRFYQEILLLTKTEGGVERQRMIPVRFVPLTRDTAAR